MDRNEPHSTRIVVWDVPGAVNAGERIRIKVGVGCDRACRARDWPIEILDAAGRTVAAAHTGGRAWPGTRALHFAELELEAPASAGSHAFEVRGAGPEVDHSPSKATVNLRVMPEPDCRIRIEALDAHSRRPVAGARVVAHPYRCRTDERGLAELSVPRGSYRIFVSGGQYLTYRAEAEIREDTTIRAQLHADTGPTDAQLWP